MGSTYILDSAPLLYKHVNIFLQEGGACPESCLGRMAESTKALARGLEWSKVVISFACFAPLSFICRHQLRAYPTSWLASSIKGM